MPALTFPEGSLTERRPLHMTASVPHAMGMADGRDRTEAFSKIPM